MGRRMSIGRATVSGSNNAPAVEIIATSRVLRIFEINISLEAATASIFGLGRPAAIGVTPTTASFFTDEDRLTAAVFAHWATAWGTPPTIPSVFLRRMSLGAAIGNSGTWTFAGGLAIPRAASVVIWNQAANSLADVNFIAEEA